MCGILGVVTQGPSLLSHESFTQALALMAHRGPDDSGVYHDFGVMIGHRRLSIIDLSGGHQPMATPDEQVWIVFNGEIYNYRSLRDGLTKKGYLFHTVSDTEVILNLYLDEGEECVRHLNGIFSFGIWDRKKHSLFLARDHLGVKPLYYAVVSDSLIFGSEIKSIFATGILAPKLNSTGLTEYFIFRDVAGDQTLFKGVKRLQPGHRLVWSKGKVLIEEYWSPLVTKTRFKGTFEDATEALDQLLDNSVRMQMVSDVPLGTFCSGGVDSSLVTAYAARAAHGQINTFSVGFHELDHDETVYARIVSSCYGTSHHEIRVSNMEFSEMLERLTWHNDEPLHFANSVQIFAISRLARKYVTVVLTGEGSDELFAGYPRYHIPSLLQVWRRFPSLVKRALTHMSFQFGDHRPTKLNGYEKLPLEMVLSLNSATLSPPACMELFSSRDWLTEYRTKALEKTVDEKSLSHRLSLLDQQTYLVSILNRQDKMSMAASIESRVPFLDTRVVEFSNSLPQAYKNRFLISKRIVKNVALRHLPKKIVHRRKSGFGVPLSKWLREDKGIGELSKLIETDEMLCELFGKVWLNKVREEHRSGQFDHSEFLWTALSFALWRKLFFDNKR